MPVSEPDTQCSSETLSQTLSESSQFPPSSSAVPVQQGSQPLPRKKHVFCNRGFTTSGHLARHLRVHTGERSHKCPFPGCEMRYARQDSLQRHYRIHLAPGSRRSLSSATYGTIAPVVAVTRRKVRSSSAHVTTERLRRHALALLPILNHGVMPVTPNSSVSQGISNIESHELRTKESGAQQPFIFPNFSDLDAGSSPQDLPPFRLPPAEFKHSTLHLTQGITDLPYCLPPPPRVLGPLSSASIPDLTDTIVRPDNWQYCAGGAFGDVFRCRYASNDSIKEVAVKSFRFGFFVDDLEHKGSSGKAARNIRRELGIWRRLSHPNIVPFLGITHGFGREGSVSLVSTWMPHGTLHKFLESHDDRLAVAHRLQFLLDIANGLDYLHSFPMVHGDLSSNNVLFDENLNACLTDFGCASLIGEIPEGLTYLKASTVRPGTLRWAAPEYLSSDPEEMKHTIKSDIYSFGNMALLVLSGKYPWSEAKHDISVVLSISQGGRPARPLERPIKDDHWSLIEQRWSSIPERPLAKNIVTTLQQFLSACTPSPSLHDLVLL